MSVVKSFNKKKLAILLILIAIIIASISIGFMQLAPKAVYISGSIEEKSTNDLCEQSSLIALGTITGKSEAFKIKNVSGSVANFTDYYFKVDSILRGNADSETVIVRVQGGTVGRYTEIYELSPNLEENNEYLLFLYKPGRGGAYNTEGDYYYVLGLTQGCFEKDGTDSFVSQNGQILSQEKLVVVLEDEAGRTVDENYFRNEYIENQKRNLQNGFITQEEFDSMMANIDVYANIIK